jgi:hypothetical protein
MSESANMTGVAAPLNNGGTENIANNSTSSLIPGDNYASGGPEDIDTQSANKVDFEGFDFNKLDDAEDEATEGVSVGEGEGEEIPEPVKKQQSPEANAAFAEIRRKAEEAEKALQERDAWVAQNFGFQGIKTWEEYQTAIEEGKRQQELARQQEIEQKPKEVYDQVYQSLVDKGYDEELAEILANNESKAVAQALRLQAFEERLQRQSYEREQTSQAAKAEAAKEQMVQELLSDHQKLRDEYGDLVPSDLSQLDQTTVEKLQRGYNLYDAWFLANRAKVVDKTQKAAAQKTLNNIHSKSHLRTEGDGAGDSNASAIPLPVETLQMYLDSGMTEKQARAFHKKLYG